MPSIKLERSRQHTLAERELVTDSRERGLIVVWYSVTPNTGEKTHPTSVLSLLQAHPLLYPNSADNFAIYIFMYIYVYVYMYIQICVYVCMYKYMYIDVTPSHSPGLARFQVVVGFSRRSAQRRCARCPAGSQSVEAVLDHATARRRGCNCGSLHWNDDRSHFLGSLRFAFVVAPH